MRTTTRCFPGSDLSRPFASCYRPPVVTVSVVLPVFAEEETVPTLVERLEQLLGGALFEILIVLSPRSPEPTRAICERIAAAHPKVTLLVQKQSPGVGFAFR